VIGRGVELDGAQLQGLQDAFSSFLRRLAGLARGGADSNHLAFLRIGLHEEAPHSSPGRISFSFSV
jgi:hypothetical protein